MSKKDQIRAQAEADLISFIRLVHPGRVLGSVHHELIQWADREEANSHQLVLLPRDHQKSAWAAYRVAHRITKNPAIRVLYISSTANLATKQLKFIKDILTSPIYKTYWPEMVNDDEGKREKWTETEISVDHPKRRAEAVRDPTIFTGGLTTTITGMHCDIAVLDDVVVYENAYTEDGRNKVEQQYSLLASIEGADAEEWIVGTRYHPKDLYGTLIEKEIDHFDDNGELLESIPLYEKFERSVENIGDGSGEFLWPKQLRKDGKPFGFDRNTLEKKRAQYLDPVQFRAQYYNDPNYSDGIGIDGFQYYDPKYLSRTDGNWYFQNCKLNVFAAIDFAFSLAKRADYTCIVVVGVDKDQNYYVLEIDRFKTDQMRSRFEHILRLHVKWDFRKLRAEVTAAQDATVKALRTDYIRPYGLALSIDDYRPTRNEGNKRERIEAILQPKYSNKQVWHYQGGNCQTLEDELRMAHPPHDDVKDALASCIDSCIPPTFSKMMSNPMMTAQTYNRFGGMA